MCHRPRLADPAAKALYFVVNDLDAIFERAKAMRCLAREEVHGGRRQDLRTALGRALVLRRGPMAQSALLRGGGHHLSGLTIRRLPKLSRGSFYALWLRAATRSSVLCRPIDGAWHFKDSGPAAMVSVGVQGARLGPAANADQAPRAATFISHALTGGRTLPELRAAAGHQPTDDERLFA